MATTKTHPADYGSPAAIRRYKNARRALLDNQEHEIAAGITRETATYRRLNRAVSDAAKNVPAWRQ
ncbi:MAG: hypothetical protein JWQ81_6524 [Amycolatopsis sp.]|uniref:hypothetical protein n=1 Tax=Amycolatopsis sp. TaxID=37632 RepID=UPI002624DD8F|nr:hypothetical protein [Amycolatopsis sp.]MCU1685785.1 hypothetical protein [Amycolatopsis sp.]